MKRKPTQFIREPYTNQNGEEIDLNDLKANQTLVANCAALIKSQETGERYIVKPA